MRTTFVLDEELIATPHEHDAGDLRTRIPATEAICERIIAE
jgi:hypothetical protein